MRRLVGFARAWIQQDAHGQPEFTLTSNLIVLLDFTTLMRLTNVSRHLLARLNALAPLIVSQQGLGHVVLPIWMFALEAA